MKFKSLSLGVYLQAPPLRGRLPGPGQGDGEKKKKRQKNRRRARLQHSWGWTVALTHVTPLSSRPLFPGGVSQRRRPPRALDGFALGCSGGGTGSIPAAFPEVGGGAPDPQGILRHLAKARRCRGPRTCHGEAGTPSGMLDLHPGG